MNTTLKKIVKGTIAIFVIKLVIVGGLFIFQSCQSEAQDSGIIAESMNNFKSALKHSQKNLKDISIVNSITTTKGNSNLAKNLEEYQGETYTVCVMAFDENTANSAEEIIENIENIGDLIDSRDMNQLVIGEYDTVDDNSTTDETDSTENFNYDNCVATFELPIQPVLDALDPVTLAAKQFFYDKGFTEDDIIEMLDGEHPSTLVPIVMNVAYSESENQASIDFLSIFSQNAHAYTFNGARECFLEATGIAAGVALVAALTAETMDKKLVKKLIKSAVKKIGARTLGGIGLALIAIDFAICMAN
ncbi:hypothetical protein [Psychroserpens algicola]|uniref:TPM domain-containing protein n=1 Tax=Psychroserpens algicola TaxID=1719034 RepID=A0ABT0H488_9FLAO|nr:hypothetical protein [Psychroserpens algicola]MCK8479196.1 hypothetical protein [Psychroserpens algicola]